MPIDHQQPALTEAQEWLQRHGVDEPADLDHRRRGAAFREDRAVDRAAKLFGALASEVVALNPEEAELAKLDRVVMVVQVDGKVRGRLVVDIDAPAAGRGRGAAISLSRCTGDRRTPGAIPKASTRWSSSPKRSPTPTAPTAAPLWR